MENKNWKVRGDNTTSISNSFFSPLPATAKRGSSLPCLSACVDSPRMAPAHCCCSCWPEQPPHSPSHRGGDRTSWSDRCWCSSRRVRAGRSRGANWRKGAWLVEQAAAVAPASTPEAVCPTGHPACCAAVVSVPGRRCRRLCVVAVAGAWRRPHQPVLHRPPSH